MSRKYYSAKRKTITAYPLTVSSVRRVLAEMSYRFLWDDFNQGPRNQWGFVSDFYMEAIAQRIRDSGYPGVTDKVVKQAIMEMARAGKNG